MSKTKTVTIRTRTVGSVGFGTCGQLVARNGHVIAETHVVPYGAIGAAVRLAEELAAERGLDVEDEETP